MLLFVRHISKKTNEMINRQYSFFKFKRPVALNTHLKLEGLLTLIR